MSMTLGSLGWNVSRNHYNLLMKLSKTRLVLPLNDALHPMKHCSSTVYIAQMRHFSSTFRGNATKQSETIKTGKELDIARKSPYAGLTMGEKVKEAGKDVYYTGFIVAGVTALGLMGYYIGSELFSGQSPNGVYTKALKVCKNNIQVIDNFGEPLKGFGETTRRGRRRHVSHSEFIKDGVKHMRMKFYIEGPTRRGTVNLEVYQNASYQDWNSQMIFRIANWEDPDQTASSEAD